MRLFGQSSVYSYRRIFGSLQRFRYLAGKSCFLHSKVIACTEDFGLPID